MAGKLDTSFKLSDNQLSTGADSANSPALVSPLSSLPPSSTFTQQWLQGPQDTSFYVRTYTASHAPARATLVFVHGFVEHIARYEHVFPAWQEKGVNVFAFDLRGFGRTALGKQRSKNSRYGKTSGPDQIEDLEWAVRTSRDMFGSDVTVFVMGHSMGGGIVLDWAMRLEELSQFNLGGVIASAPLLLQTNAASKIARWAGEKISLLSPYSLIPVPIKPEDMSRDLDTAEAYSKDPLVVRKGSLRGISDMLNRGETILATRYKQWPKELPLLIVHGTSDQVTSHIASQRLHDSLNTTDKQISLYEGGFHELHNEPSPIKENFVNDCIAWVEARVPLSQSVPATLAPTSPRVESESPPAKL